jgi:hypothetical protein
MRLTTAIEIVEKATDFLAQPDKKRSVLRLSDVGLSSVKEMAQAMLLGMADQYQLVIASGRDFERLGELCSWRVAHFVFGGCLPADIYDKVVRENPDPERLFHALINEGHAMDKGDALDTESGESFRKFLTSLDPLGPTYWPAVYARLGLPYDSDTVPSSRIYIDPENVLLPEDNVSAIAASPPKAPKRGGIAGIFAKPLYLLSLTQDGQWALFAFADGTHREMEALLTSGRTNSLYGLSWMYFKQRQRFISSVRDRFRSYSWIELNDYDFSLLAAIIANYVIQYHAGTVPRESMLAAKAVKLLEQILEEMVAVGPKTGQWGVQRAIDGARQQFEQHLSLLGTPPTPASES